MKTRNSLHKCIYGQGPDVQYSAQQIAEGIVVGYIEGLVTPKDRDTVLSAHTMPHIYEAITTSQSVAGIDSNKFAQIENQQLGQDLEALCAEPNRLEVIGNELLKHIQHAPRKPTALGQMSWDYGHIKKSLRMRQY